MCERPLLPLPTPDVADPNTFQILLEKHKNDWMHDLHQEKHGFLSTLWFPMETVFHEKKHEDEGNLTK